MGFVGHRKSILIIDDDPVYMKMVHEWLKGEYRVTMTISGEQAFRWLKENKADLILLDYELPVMPGPQIMEKIRSGADTKTTPVMILTGKNDRESIMRILSLNPADYLLKNIGREELLNKVDGFLR
ncbi:MAG: response regulator [Lachnospiraceae bacterium]|nr:response regulator [Lachnospiraceae bacterium]